MSAHMPQSNPEQKIAVNNIFMQVKVVDVININLNNA